MSRDTTFSTLLRCATARGLDVELVERTGIRTLLHTICTLRNTLARAACADAFPDI